MEAPPQPPETADEKRAKSEITAMLQHATTALHRRNLEAAVWLAVDALENGGDLAEHFAEIGRRFGNRIPPAARAKLRNLPIMRVIQGGAT